MKSTSRLAAGLLPLIGMAAALTTPAAIAGNSVGITAGFNAAALVVGLPFTANLQLTNTSDGAEALNPITLSQIRLVPSCKSTFDLPSCENNPADADLGVFSIDGTAVGTAGACIGTNFTVAPVPGSTSGQVEFTAAISPVLPGHAAPIPLPPDPGASWCQITFTGMVLSPPPRPAPFTTNPIGSVQFTAGGNQGTSDGTATVTVTQRQASFDKAFSPTTIPAGGVTRLTFTITNPAPNNPAQVFSLTDTLPSKLQVSGVPNVQSTCTGGTITAAAGSSTITVAGATVAASAAATSSCTIAVDVTNVPLQVGACPDANLTNGPSNITGLVNLTNGVAPSCVTVTPQPPSLNKAFSPTTIAAGGTTTLTFTLTNPTPSNPAQTVSFTDTLPSKLQVAAVPNIGGTCTGGTVTAAAGSNAISVTNRVVPASGAAAASCTISVDVTNVPLQTGTCPDANLTNASANLSGLVNVVNAVTPSCVTVTQQVPSLSKGFSPSTIALGGITTLTFTIVNPAPNNPAQVISFVDTLPSKLQIAAAPNVQSTCTGGTVTAVAGASAITVAAATVGASGAAATSCTIKVDVTNVPQQTGTCPDVDLTNTSANISGLSNLVNGVAPSCVTVNAFTFAINKTASVPSALPNSSVTFTVTVTNNGPASADGSLLTDPAVGGFSATGVTCTGSSGGAACPAGVTIANLQGAGITLTTFPSGSTLTFDLAGTFTLPVGAVTNTATISSPPGIIVPPRSASATVAAIVPTVIIPTLGDYTLMALMLLLAAAGAAYVRREQG